METEVFSLKWQFVNQAEKRWVSFQPSVTEVSIRPARLEAAPTKTVQDADWYDNCPGLV